MELPYIFKKIHAILLPLLYVADNKTIKDSYLCNKQSLTCITLKRAQNHHHNAYLNIIKVI